MYDIDVWDLVNLLENFKLIGYKLGYKTRRDSKGNMKHFKAILVAKCFGQREAIDFNETFIWSLAKILLQLLWHWWPTFKLELNHMNMKTTSLNGQPLKEVYVLTWRFWDRAQRPQDMQTEKSLYDRRQASHRLLNFDQMVISFRFKRILDEYIYISSSVGVSWLF